GIRDFHVTGVQTCALPICDVGRGVGVAVAVLLLLTWFAWGVVLRATVTQLRRDLGWWRLHGVPSARGWLLALSQSAVPVISGARSEERRVGKSVGTGCRRS